MERSNPIARKSRLYWGVAIAVVLSDAFTKIIAVDTLGPIHLPRPVIGEALRFSLVYNQGAAFGLHVGAYSRWIFTALTFAALVLLWNLYRSTKASDRRRLLALALVSGGAVGNVVDRLKSGRGVVDFIDIGVGLHRWPTFNVADTALSCGAVLLAIVLSREDATAAPAATKKTFSSTARGTDAPLRG